jgi:hypothetical protein
MTLIELVCSPMLSVRSWSLTQVVLAFDIHVVFLERCLPRSFDRFGCGITALVVPQKRETGIVSCFATTSDCEACPLDSPPPLGKTRAKRRWSCSLTRRGLINLNCEPGLNPARNQRGCLPLWIPHLIVPASRSGVKWNLKVRPKLARSQTR